MAKTQESTAFYLRQENGETFYVDTLDEALTYFAGPEGYRLTLRGADKEVVIRKFDVMPGQISGTTHAASVVVRDREV